MSHFEFVRMKTFTFFIILISSVSCSNFYEFKSQTTEHELHRAFEMDLKDKKVDFKAYNDYYFDTINLSAVYISKKQLNRIKKLTVKARNSQVLFLHNYSPFYLNIIGFYYPNLYLNEVNSPNIEFTEQKLTNGFCFNYEIDKKLISDFYIPQSNGVLRLIAVGSPKHENNIESYQKEIDYVFFVLNPELFKLKTN